MKKTGIKVIAAAMSLMILLTGCSSAEGNLFVNDYLENNGVTPPQMSSQAPSDNSADDSPAYEFGSRGTSLSLTADKELNISRVSTGSSPAPNDGIWTVFVYMCGADLETDLGGGGAATRDIMEMIDATKVCSDLRFAVEAGGSNKWHNEWCADKKNTRLVISGGKVQTIAAETANMGDPNTLVDFLDWGLENYRSQYIMLDMWDHGGGSLMGVCQDERYDDDIISLAELDAALLYALGNRGIKLDMIGCDACLMATVEMANICVPYADYMLASEETEWGGGWEYSGFSKGINAGAKDSAALGKYICDAFYSSMNANPNTQTTSTLSVVDLSKLDDLLLAFNSYCTDIYNAMRGGSYDKVLQNVSKNMIHFFAEAENDCCMGDMHSFIKSTSAFSDKADRTLSLLNDCVTYKVNGNNYRDAGGISIFYPFSSLHEYYINIAKNLCVTPYYLGIVDSVIYGKDTMGDISGYDPEQWIDDDSEYWSDNDVDTSEYGYWEGEQDNALNTDMDQAGILFAVAPHVETRERESEEFVSTDTFGGWLFNGIMNIVGSIVSDEYNVYTFTFSNAGLQKVDSVHTDLFAVANDSTNRTVLLELGGMFKGDGDTFRSGYPTVEEEFYGMTVGLPNGTPFSVHPMSRRYVEGYGWVCMYYAPVRVNNGADKLLIISEDYSAGTDAPPRYIAVGTLDVENNGASPRMEPLNSGDTLRPLFPGYYADTMEFAGYFTTGTTQDYALDTDGAFGLVWYAPLPNGNYLLSYRINDIYGNSFSTPFVQCVVDTANQNYPYSMIG
ncbi:MAG: hypothetical protein HDT43_07345 [Ruminococcaceae bacterium]|nr:hypothetical protein [Oscillospiraceae bacterium]